MSSCVFGADQHLTARKRHVCWWCGEPIESGETYVQRKGVCDNRFWVMRAHPECHDAEKDSNLSHAWYDGCDLDDERRLRGVPVPSDRGSCNDRWAMRKQLPDNPLPGCWWEVYPNNVTRSVRLFDANENLLGTCWETPHGWACNIKDGLADKTRYSETLDVSARLLVEMIDEQR